MLFAAKFNHLSPLNFQAPTMGRLKWALLLLQSGMQTGQKDGVVQVSTFIYFMGPEAENFFKSFAFVLLDMPTSLTCHTEIQGAFHFIPIVNIIYERSCFYTRSQKKGESVEELVCTLYELWRGWVTKVTPSPAEIVYPTKLSKQNFNSKCGFAKVSNVSIIAWQPITIT